MAHDSVTKAQGLLSFLQAVKDLAPPERYLKMVDALQPATRDFVLHRPVSGTWLPIAIEDDLVRMAHVHANDGDFALMQKIGQTATAADFRGVYRAFVKVLSPSFVVKRANLIWQMYYKENGQIHVESFSEEQRRSEIHYLGMACASPAWWHYQVGSLLGLVEATRMKEPKVDIIAKGGNAKDCHYMVRWS